MAKTQTPAPMTVVRTIPAAIADAGRVYTGGYKASI
jgi:hypothetical protein